MSQYKQSEGIRSEKSLLEYLRPMDHACMMEGINLLCERYPYLAVSYVGESMMGRGIPLLCLGEGKKAVLYVGAHRGREWMSSAILLRMVNEYCEGMKSGGKLLHYNLRYLFSSRTLYWIPMLNPDGVEYVLHGVGKDHVMRERLLSMNGGSKDFSSWEANGRGVELSRNFGMDFAVRRSEEMERGIYGGAPRGFSGEMPESEPEVAQLCNWLHYHRDVSMVLTVGEGAYGVYGASDDTGRALAREAGCRVKDNTECGLEAWCGDALGIPAYSVRYGTGREAGEIRELFYHYTRLRRALFIAPSFI